MMFVSEADVVGFQNKYNLPVVKSRCPIDGYTKRQYAKELVKELNLAHPGAKQRMFTAYNYYSNKKWSSADSYHMCLDSSVLGIEGTAEAIKKLVELKEQNKECKPYSCIHARMDKQGQYVVIFFQCVICTAAYQNTGTE